MFQETIVLTLAYVLIIAIAFAPKCPHVSPDSPVDYFPEVIDKSIEKTHLVNLPDTTASPNYSTKPSYSQNVSFIKLSENATPSPLPQAIAPETSLHGLSIRELKKLASTRKVKRYSNLNKQQLILALT
jgi:hypothetical protein